jgi:hypothetical protein
MQQGEHGGRRASILHSWGLWTLTLSRGVPKIKSALKLHMKGLHRSNVESGTSRHFAAMQRFGRFRGEADIAGWFESPEDAALQGLGASGATFHSVPPVRGGIREKLLVLVICLSASRRPMTASIARRCSRYGAPAPSASLPSQMSR